MAYKITYWAIIAFAAIGMGYVYLHRLEIPITRNFEAVLDEKIISFEKEKKELALAIVGLDADQRAEIAFRKAAESNSYSNPFRALNKQWYKAKINILRGLQFLFTYRIIFYIALFLLILYAVREIFWKYYAF